MLVFLNMAGITVSAAQAGGLIDAWIVGLKQEYPSVNYGLIRGTGSLAFAISAQVAGILTISFGHDVRLWVGGSSLVLAIVIALSFRSARRADQVNAEKANGAESIKGTDYAEDSESLGGIKEADSITDAEKNIVQKLSGIEAIKLVFSSKQYNLLLAVSFFLLLSNTTMLTLNQLLVRDLGGTTAQMGTASAVMAGSEVPLMFMMAIILKKVGFKKLLIFCSAFYAIRLFLMASVESVNGLIYVQLMQGLTYAVLIPIAMSYLSQILDERVRSTAVTTYASITVGLTGILGSTITTALLAAGFSAQAALIVFSFSAIIGFSLALFGVLRKLW